MAIKSSLYITYDGRNSQDFGIMNVTTSTGLYEEPFAASREIKSIQIKGKKKEYFQRVQDKPLEFTLQLAFEDVWDDTSIRDISRWLTQSDSNFPIPKPLIFSDNPDQIFYTIYNGQPKIVHTGGETGYIEIDFHCNSPYAYSPYYFEPTPDPLDLSANVTGGTVYEIVNVGDTMLQPEIWITKVGDDNGDIKIVNESNGNTTFQFTTATKARGTITFSGNVVDGETVTIGRDIYEFDTNGTVVSGHILVDVSTDQTPSNAVAQLASLINSSTSKLENVSSVADATANTVTVTYGLVGTVGNLAVSDTCANGVWSSTTLVGVDGLLNGEEVYVNCEREYIESSLEYQNIYRFDSFNDGYFSLPYGANRLRIYGNCKVQFRYQYGFTNGL